MWIFDQIFLHIAIALHHRESPLWWPINHTHTHTHTQCTVLTAMWWHWRHTKESNYPWHDFQKFQLWWMSPFLSWFFVLLEVLPFSCFRPQYESAERQIATFFNHKYPILSRSTFFLLNSGNKLPIWQNNMIWFLTHSQGVSIMRHKL